MFCLLLASGHNFSIIMAPTSNKRQSSSQTSTDEGPPAKVNVVSPSRFISRQTYKPPQVYLCYDSKAGLGMAEVKNFFGLGQ